MAFLFFRMKNALSYLLVIIVHVCCNNHRYEHVPLLNNISFKLIDGEKVVEIDDRIEQKYNSHFDSNVIQIPLFRCVQNDSYIIYLGIPYNTSLKELANCSVEQSPTKVIFEGDSTKEIYKSFVSEKDYVTSYARNFDNNLVYVLAVANSALLSDTLFSREELSNRFIK